LFVYCLLHLTLLYLQGANSMTEGRSSVLPMTNVHA
jgi:hypothetical protein